MKLSDKEKIIVEQRFDSFCKKTLRNARRNIKKKEDREKENDRQLLMQLKSSLEDCSGKNTLKDKYPSDFYQFTVDHYLIEIENDQLARALETLSGKKRNIVLLAYFLDMTDQEIASNLDTSRALVQKQRQKSLNTIKQILNKK